MHDPLFFVDVRKASVKYTEKLPLVKRLAGQAPMAAAVLHDITLRVPQGSWITIFGAEGSGKTTLLRLLTGIITPTEGVVRVNGKAPQENSQAAAGYVSAEESEPAVETAEQILQMFIKTHGITDGLKRLHEISDQLEVTSLLGRRMGTLSFTQKLKLNVVKAIISDAPALLFDDVADILSVEYMQKMLRFCKGRNVFIATRFSHIAEALELPMVLLHGATLAHYGTCEDIADSVSCPRVVDVWVEGLRYDLLRQLRRHTGVVEVRLLPTDQFSGQRVRIILRSSRYLPAMYDMVSQAALIKIEELPPSLSDILSRLE